MLDSEEIQFDTPEVEARPQRSEAPQGPSKPEPEVRRPHVSLASGAPHGSWARSRRRLRVRWMLFALLPLVLIVGAYFYVTGGKVMTTDDAYVNAKKVEISTDVSGIV